MVVRRRISALVNRSAAVKRVRACSSAASSPPLRWRARAALRRWSICSHFSDSGIAVRIHNVSSAGRMPMRNKYRQDSGPNAPT